MEEQTRIEKAAEFLVRCRRDNVQQDRIPEECRPQSTGEALAVQQKVLELIGEKAGGWKCSVPSGDKLTVAPLPATGIRRNSPCPIRPTGSIAEIEPEIAFILGRTLDPRHEPYIEDEIRSPIAETRMV